MPRAISPTFTRPGGCGRSGIRRGSRDHRRVAEADGVTTAFEKRLAEVEREVARIAPPPTPEWLRWLTDSELTEAVDLFDRENVEGVEDLSEPARLHCMAIYLRALARMAEAGR
jgi:hypothetical protein